MDPEDVASSSSEKEEEKVDQTPRDPYENVTLEQYIKENQEKAKSFKDMLQEKGLMPFSEFDKFLPKMIHDTRYTAIPNKFRRPLFDDLVKNYAVEFHKNKQAEKKAVQDTLKSLLEEYEKADGFLKKPSYKEFKKHFENDKRFAEVLKSFDVEKYFNAKLEAFERNLKDEKAKAKYKFSEMIREYLMKEKDVDRGLKWKSVKKALKKDPRYELVSSSKDRETIFLNILKEMAHSKKERDRSRSRDKKKEKPSETAIVFKDNEDPSERINKMKKKEYIDTFNILLAEKIKTYNIKYQDAMDILKKDPRYSGLQLDRETKEDLFNHYAENKRKDSIAFFKNLLNEKKHEFKPTLQYDEAAPMFEVEKRFDLKTKDAKKEFDDFMENLKDEILLNFEKFLAETPYINKDSPIEGEEFEKLLQKLEKDVRYVRMEYWKEKRERLIKAKIQAIKQEYEKKHGTNHPRLSETIAAIIE